MSGLQAFRCLHKGALFADKDAVCFESQPFIGLGLRDLKQDP